MKINLSGVNTSVPALADDAAYVLVAIAGYEGFATANPTIAFYLGLTAAALFTLSNRLGGSSPAPASATH